MSLWMTQTGWMMWTLMLTGLACHARVVLYDGSPFHPSVESYLKLINDVGVTVLGTSPRFLAEVQGSGLEPRTSILSHMRTHCLRCFGSGTPVKIASFGSIRVVSVTGAVLTPPMFEWTQKAFGGKIHLISTSGGTDICTSCEQRPVPSDPADLTGIIVVTGAATLPVYTGGQFYPYKTSGWRPNHLHRDSMQVPWYEGRDFRRIRKKYRAHRPPWGACLHSPSPVSAAGLLGR